MMTTDALTQLQVELNKYMTQQFSTFSYLAQRHPLVAPKEIPGLKFTSEKLRASEPGPEDADSDKSAYPLQPQDEKAFEEAQIELAEDLVLQTQRLNRLIALLPGIDQDEKQQADDIRRLAAEVDEIDQKRRAKRREMRLLAGKLDGVVGGMSRSLD